MKKSLILYILVVSILVTLACAVEIPELPQYERPLPYQGTTPRDAAISLFRLDSELIGISTQIYNNVVKMAPSLYIQNDTGLSELNPWDDMTQDELAQVKLWAAEITQGCNTADDKIYAVMKYVASNVYYDMDFYNNYDGSEEQYQQMLNHNAYDVLTNKTAVCYGYSATAAALLQISGVPCVMIESPAHAWNMAYNGERWVLFDTTWISSNKYEDGQFNKDPYLMTAWFDFTLEKANSDYNHIITGADYCEYDNTIYDVPINTASGSFEIPQNIVTISDLAFYEAGDLVITGDLRNVTSIGTAAFFNCYAFDGVINLSNAVYIGEQAFRGCASLDGITSLQNATDIGVAAFYECTSLDGVVSFGALENISDYAFYKCPSLDGIKNIENVLSIGYGAFCDCSQLTGILDLQSVESIGAFSFDATKLERVYIPNADITIEDYAFQHCRDITIYARKGSNAEAHASYFRIPFVDIDELTFTISYDANGGSGAPENTVKKYGVEALISELLPTRKGADFIAWSSSPDGNAEYSPGDSYTVNSDISLYALWEAIIYGDVQGDGNVDVSDAINILRRIASSDTDAVLRNADVNGDGYVDVSDVIRILQHIANPSISLG